jgi:hypothetical protein
MAVVPSSPTSTSKFKSDVTALATYVKQPVCAADGGALETSAKPFRKSLQLSRSRFGKYCAKSQHLLAAEGYPILLGVMLIAITLALVTGCGSSGSVTPPVAIGGSVQGGHRPVSGASVQLYAASSRGLGSASTPLLQKAVASDSNGNFSIPSEYSCPSPSSEVYVVAKGGRATSSSGENSAVMLTAMLGRCSGLAALGSVSVNEVTTVGSVWPLAHYFTSPTHLGSTSSDTSFLDAVSSVPEFINLAQGSSPGTPTSTSYFAENSKLYSLADVLAACISSSGGKAGDGSPCGELFSMASSAGGRAPTDTMTAAIQIAQNPDNNVAGIYDLVKDSTDFEPTVTAAPSDWTLPLTYLVATPSISLATGTYSGTQEVTISDATEGSTIYYTTDGTVPTSSSSLYTGPISIAVSSTIKAIAVLTGSSSGVASSTLTITAPSLPTAVKLAFSMQPSNALTGATITPAVQVSVEDSSGTVVTTATNPVTLALAGGTGLAGTLTATPQNGVATFSNLSASTAGSYTLSASSPSLTSATSAGFTITAPSLPTAVKLAFSMQPSNELTGATITPAVQVSIEDSSGTVVTTATNSVTLALVGGTGLGGTLTATPQNGVATFSNLSASTAGSYALSASSPSLTSATSAGFTITAPSLPTAVKLAFSVQPLNALTGATITPAVRVSVEDSSGTVVTTATNSVTLALVGGTGLGGTLTATPQNGVATFSNLSASTAGSYTLSASSPSLTSATSAGFTITAPSLPTAVKLAFSVQPSNAATQATLTPAVQVSVEDSSGTVVTTATNPVTLALVGGTGLAGTLTATPQNGVATFSNLTVSNAGTYTLSASSPSLTSATSAGFTITALASSTCSITSFGAVGDGATDNTTAIQNTFNYAATNHCTALIPAGTFAYSGNITAAGIAVTGNGASSILKATNFANSALILTGTGGSITNLSMTSAATTRLSTPQSAMIWANGAKNYLVQNVLINGSPSVGIFSIGSSGGQILNNTVENTLADSISQISGANNITIRGNRVLNAGDDGISNNSYVGDGSTVNNITIAGNTILNNRSGRGLEVSGGNTLTFSGNYVDNKDGYADMYISSENSAWVTQNTTNVTVSGNSFVDGGPNQGSALIWAEGSSQVISGITLNGNQFVNPTNVALQLAGSGSETIVVENNTDYSSGQFSTSSDTGANATQTGNQVLAPSTYSTALVPAGGGCNFSGC